MRRSTGSAWCVDRCPACCGNGPSGKRSRRIGGQYGLEDARERARRRSSPVYCMRGDGRGVAAAPCHAGPGSCAPPPADDAGDEQEDRQPTARGRDGREDPEELVGARGRGKQSDGRADEPDTDCGDDPQEDGPEGVERHRHEHRRRGLLGDAEVRVPRASKERDPERTRHRERADGADEGEDGGGGDEHDVALDERCRAGEQGRVNDELTDEAIERGQRRDRERPDQEQRRRVGQSLCEAAKVLDVHGVGRAVDRPCGVEEETLEDRVIEEVQQAPGEPGECHGRRSPGDAEVPDPEAHRRDADVLGRRVSEEALQITLGRRVEDAEERRERAEREDGPAHPFVRAPQEEGEAEEREEAGLVDDARHERRHVRGRGGVGAREPGVEREERRLESERHAEQQEDGPARRARSREELSEHAEVHRLRPAVKEHEGGDEHEQADVRRDQVVEAGEPNLLVLVVPDHEQPRADRGDLPAEEKDERVLDRIDEDEGDRRHVQQREVRAAMPALLEVGLEVSDRVDGPREGHGQGPREEERAERVDPERDAVDGRRPWPGHFNRCASAEHRDHAHEYERARGQLARDGNERAHAVRAQG